jgi:uncharacterized protein involved in outer membrane biogenesis
VIYSNLAPWPTNADGFGPSLQRRVGADYGNDPLNWKADAPTAGSANLSLNLPSITFQPQSRSVFVGETVSFTVAASGDAPLSYQWLSNNVPLTGRTETNLDLINVKISAAANYRAQVTNPAGSVLSDEAVLTVTAPPAGSATLINGNTVRLTFPVLPDRTYQVEYKNNLTDLDWLPLGAPVPASTDTLIVEETVMSQPERFYRLALVP